MQKLLEEMKDQGKKDAAAEPVKRYADLWSKTSDALKELTGQNLEGAAAWRKWWGENKSKFKIQD